MNDKLLKNSIWILFSIPSFIMACKGAIDVYHSQKVKWWESATAVVDSVYRSDTHHGKNNSQQVDVIYSYRINNTQYTNTVIAYGYSASNIRSFDKSIYTVLSKARTIRIYVNPNNAAESVITTGINYFILLYLLPAVVILGVYKYKWLFKNPFISFLLLIVLLAFFTFSGFDISKQIVVLTKI